MKESTLKVRFVGFMFRQGSRYEKRSVMFRNGFGRVGQAQLGEQVVKAKERVGHTNGFNYFVG